MNSPEKSQQELAELLNLTPTSQPKEETLPQTHLDLIEIDDFTHNSSDSDPQTVPNPQKSVTEGINRLAFVALGSGVVVLFFVGFFLFGMNLKDTVTVEEPTVEEETEKIQITAEEKQDQLYRARIALGEQKEDFARIDHLKAEKIEIAPSKEEIKPTVAKPQPAPATPTLQPEARKPISRPQIHSQIKPKVSTEPKYNTLADWQKLANFGAYGASDYSETEVIRRRDNPVVDQQIIPSNKVSPYVMSSRDRNFTELSPIARAKYNSETEMIAGEKRLISTLKSIKSTETIGTQKPHRAKANQRLEAKLLNPIQWADEADEGYSSLLNLEEDLMDASGKVLIPEDSQLVYQIKSITKNGLIRGQLTTAIIDGEEVSIPKGAISLRNKKGGLLVAKYKDLNNGSGSRDMMRFASGAIDGLSEVIDRPQRTSSSSTNFGTSISTDYGDPNYIETALSKGVADILEGRVKEMERAYDNAPILGIWELKEGTKLTLIINRSFEFDN